jgi:2-polyprenyl-6-methoxyphenol hydroxylase-like FAD-dependent oxidoreductase
MDEIVDASEAAAFATGRPGAFPAPCYSPCQQLLLPRAGSVLVGDAIHSFPPDIGQGVNAALSDVMLLARALDDATAAAVPLPPRTPLMPLLTPSAAARLIERALPAYGKACAPEAEAVARIAQIGFPYQYPLTRERNPLARPLWFANFLLRTFVLAKLAPRIFAPAAIVLVQRPHLSYQAVWQTAQQTTRRLQAIATCVLAAVAWPWLRRALLGA